MKKEALAKPMPTENEMEEVPTVAKQPVGREIFVPDDYTTIGEAIDSAGFGILYM